MDSKTRKFLTVLALAALPFCAATSLLLTSVFGTPVVAVRCTRSGGPARCEVLQSSFFGLGAYSSFAIPESEISGAETLFPRAHGGRGAGEYSASLSLKSGPYRHYPVVHSRFYERADTATRRLNAYFATPEMTSIELREDSSELALLLIAPLAVTAVALVGAALRRRARDADSP
jgi:hypothetical protein